MPPDTAVARADSAALAPPAAPPAGLFPTVPIATESPVRHTWSYVAMGSGVVLVGASFLLAHQANDAYAAYLRETDPTQIETLFDRTVLLDRSSSGALLLGEALLCLGLYDRFLRKPTAAMAWWLEPGRCAVSYRF